MQANANVLLDQQVMLPEFVKSMILQSTNGTTQPALQLKLTHEEELHVPLITMPARHPQVEFVHYVLLVAITR